MDNRIKYEGDEEFAVSFKRGDKVNFKGNGSFEPVNGTYVWAIMGHGMIRYVIEHPNGNPKSHFMASMGPDGFESIHSSQLDHAKKYIYAKGGELEMVKAK